MLVTHPMQILSTWRKFTMYDFLSTITVMLDYIKLHKEELWSLIESNDLNDPSLSISKLM